MSDLKDISAKVFISGTLSTAILGVGKYFFTDSGFVEVLVPSVVIWFMIFFVSAMLYNDAEKKEKEKRKQDWRQNIENRVEKLEEEN